MTKLLSEQREVSMASLPLITPSDCRGGSCGLPSRLGVCSRLGRLRHGVGLRPRHD